MSDDVSYKRPESVLVVVYTRQAEVLLLERVQPAGFWQAVTGSMEWQENDPLATAQRELAEETGLNRRDIIDCHKSYRFPILPQWRHRYAADVTENIERLFALELTEACDIRLNPEEHRDYRWLPKEQAIVQVDSWTNKDAIQRLL